MAGDRGPAPHAHQRVAARCGRQRLPKTGTHDDSILLDRPYLVSWILLVLKAVTDGHLDGHLFEFNYTDFLEQFRISRNRLGLDDLVPYQMRHSGVEQQIPKPPGGSETRKVAATSVHGTMGFAAHSWELDRYLASQVDTCRCLRRLFQEVPAGNILCVFIAAPFFESPQLAQFLGNYFENSRVCVKNRVS